MRPPFIICVACNAAALWVAVRMVPGLSYTEGSLPFLGVALAFGVVTAVLGTMIKVLASPSMVLALELFIFVINALLLWLASSISDVLGLGFHASGLGPTVLGAVVMTLVGTALAAMLHRPRVIVVHRDA